MVVSKFSFSGCHETFVKFKLLFDGCMSLWCAIVLPLVWFFWDITHGFPRLYRAKWCTSCTYTIWIFCKGSKVSKASYTNLLYKVLLMNYSSNCIFGPDDCLLYLDCVTLSLNKKKSLLLFTAVPLLLLSIQKSFKLNLLTEY